MSTLKRTSTCCPGTFRVALFVAALIALGAQAAPSANARTGGAQAAALAYAVGADAQGRGLLVAFDPRTGAVVKRITEPVPWQSPDLLVSPAGDHLYLLAAISKTRTTVLSLIDTHSWAVLASTPLPDALLYTVTGPSTLVLTPDGARLLVYSYDGLRGGDAYWLAFLDPVSLKLLPTRVPLPGCGGAYFAVTQGQVVALCAESNDVRFIDPQAARVIATVPLPTIVSPHRPEGRVAGLAVAQNQSTIYVVSNDLRLMAISTKTHTVVRQVTTWQQQPQTVRSLNSVAVSADGRQLIVGVLAQPRDPASAFALRVFTLPDLQLARTIPLPRLRNFVAAPIGGLYLFQVGDDPVDTQDGRVQWIGSDLMQTTTVGQFNGPLYHIVFSRAANQGSSARAKTS